MPTSRRIKRATRILAAMLMVQTQGCVTKGDLAKVQQELAADMRTARQDVRSLRGTLESVQSKAQQEGTTTATFEARLKTLERKQEVISEEVVSQRLLKLSWIEAQLYRSLRTAIYWQLTAALGWQTRWR
jgi:hypothetical protein